MNHKYVKILIVLAVSCGALALLLFGLNGQLPVAMATSYHSIAINNDLSDFASDEYLEEDEGYDLYLTWNADYLYLGLSEAYLGDMVGQDMSFFVAIDTDQVPGSGAPTDGYGQVQFSNAYLPEHVYYFAGGAGWYEWSTWDGSGWIWNGWRSDGTYYNWPGNTGVITGSKMRIEFTDIQTPTSIAVYTWLTNEDDSTVQAAWPAANPTGISPTLTSAYVYPTLEDNIGPDIAVAANGDHVLINEFAPKGTEWIELYNPTTATISLAGWYLTDGEAVDGMTGTIPAGGYLVTGTANIFLSNTGDEIMLYDASSTLVDMVAFGINGAAPIAPTGSSTARSPNAADTDDDAGDWTLDQTPTQGAVNDAPPIALGTSLVINEINNYSPPATDTLELYNPLTTSVPITGWMFSDGDGWATISSTASVPAGGWLLIYPNDYSVYFTNEDVAYLFMPDGTRVDQIGWEGEFEENTFQRIPDGAGPHDGYDWESSGAPCHWRDLPETLGYTNAFSPDLSIEKMGTSLAMPGSMISYTIIYTNLGGSAASQVVLTDELPGGLSYMSDTSGLPCPACSVGATGVLTWEVGTLDVCGDNTFVLTAWVTDSVPYGSILTNTVHIGGAEEDFTPADNTDTWATSVSALDLVVDKTGPEYGMIDGEIVYTITLENQGVETATNVILTDTLPMSTTYVSDDSGIVPTNPISGVYVWSFGALPSGTLSTVHLTVMVNAEVTGGTTLTNTVEVSTDTPGDNPANNVDTWATTVYPLVSIYDVQFVPDPATDDTSPYNEQTVWVEGVVVAETGELNDSYYVIQDPAGGPWSGVEIYISGVFTDVMEGEYVRVLGEVEEYFGMTELNARYAPHAQQVLSTSVPLPAPVVITQTGIFTTSSPTTSEPYEAVLIEFQDASVTDPDIGFGQWLFSDSSGAAMADDEGDNDGDLNYTPQLDDYYEYIRGIGWYSFGDYKLQPRYRADIELAYPVTFVYNDLEDVVHSGESVFIAGDFNSWDPTVNQLTPDTGHDTFSTTITLATTGTVEYKYVVYTDTVPSGPAQWDWLQTANRFITITQPTTIDDYRNVIPGYVVLQWPPTLTTTVGMPTEDIYGQVWAGGLTGVDGPPRAMLSQVGFGTAADPGVWTTWEDMDWNAQQGNNDEFVGVLTPTMTGVYSYVVRFNPNWAAANPNDEWFYGDLDGVFPGEPFEIANAGVLTVTQPPQPDISAAKTSSNPGEMVMPGDLITYTVSLTNSGELDANATVTDVLGDYYTVYEPMDFTEVTTGTLVWTGVVSAGQVIDLHFVVQVNDMEFPAGTTMLENTAMVADGTGTVIEVSDPMPPLVEILVFVYHDLEDVVHSGESVFIAGTFNGWDPLANQLTPSADASTFSTTVTLATTGTLEYKYVVYTDTVPSGPAQWDWLQTNNRIITTTQQTIVDDYRNIEPGYVVLQSPATLTTTAGMPTDNIYGQMWARGLTEVDGPPRAMLAQVGFGTATDPAAWTTWEGMDWNTQVGNNDEFVGVLTPTMTGVYSYVVRFNPNWAAGNPNNEWSYGDLDGGDPFNISQAGVMTVTLPAQPVLAAAKTSSNPGEMVMLGDLITYTITLTNSGGVDASVTVTDVLGDYYTVYEPMDFTEVMTGTLVWTGVVSAMETIDLHFVVQVEITGLSGGVTPLENTAMVDDGTGMVIQVTDPAPPQVEMYSTYLPIILRNATP